MISHKPVRISELCSHTIIELIKADIPMGAECRDSERFVRYQAPKMTDQDTFSISCTIAEEIEVYRVVPNSTPVDQADG